LLFNEEAVLGFDSNFKLMPPLRSEKDRKALWCGVNDGTIDMIVSDHRPHDKEEKDVEFDNASFGNIQLQTVFGALGTCQEFNLSVFIDGISKNTRNLLSIDENPIEVGNYADLTLFCPDSKWIFSEDQVISSTNNTPLLNKELTGHAFGIINNGKFAYKETLHD